MFRQLPATVAAAVLIVIISAVSAQNMAPGPSPYYSPTTPSATAPAPGVDCLTQLLNLSDCLTYVETGSSLTKPDKACCPELAGLVDSNPICLCQLLTLNASSYGFDIDRKRAFGLPSVCSVVIPPVSLCPGVTESPMGAPSPSQGGGGAPDMGGAPAGGPMGPSPYSSPTTPSATAPAPGVDCLTQLLNLSDCLTYVETGSSLTKPDKACCPELAGLVDSNPICLCQLLTLNASSYGFDIDRKRAFGLPSVCSVAIPPLSLCPGVTESPMEAPSPSQGGGGGGGGGAPDMGEAPGGGPMGPSPSPSPSPSNSESSGSGTGPSGHGSHTASPELSAQLLFTTTTLFLLLSTSLFFRDN